MQLARMIGIIIDFGFPAIVIGGLMYHWFHSWTAVWIWEIILVIIAFKVAFTAAGKPDPSGGH